MTTRVTFDTIEEAALAVGVTAVELAQAVDLAALEAAKPSAIQCTLPGPIQSESVIVLPRWIGRDGSRLPSL